MDNAQLDLGMGEHALHSLAQPGQTIHTGNETRDITQTFTLEQPALVLDPQLLEIRVLCIRAGQSLLAACPP